MKKGYRAGLNCPYPEGIPHHHVRDFRVELLHLFTLMWIRVGGEPWYSSDERPLNVCHTGARVKWHIGINGCVESAQHQTARYNKSSTYLEMDLDRRKYLSGLTHHTLTCVYTKPYSNTCLICCLYSCRFHWKSSGRVNGFQHPPYNSQRLISTSCVAWAENILRSRKYTLQLLILTIFIFYLSFCCCDQVVMHTVCHINFLPWSTREILKETLEADEEFNRDKWTMFGNEVEKVEIDVIRNQHVLRTRADRLAFRMQVRVKFWCQGWIFHEL